LSQNTLWQPSDPNQMFRSSAFKSNVHKGYLEQQRLSKPKAFSKLSASVLFLTDRPMADRQLRLYSAGLPLYSGLLPKQQGSKTSLTHHKYATWSTCSFCVHESSLNFWAQTVRKRLPKRERLSACKRDRLGNASF
jgi:hypothetical protein